MNDTPRIFIGSTTCRVIGMGSSECANAVLLKVRAVTGVDDAFADIKDRNAPGPRRRARGPRRHRGGGRAGGPSAQLLRRR